MPWLISRVLQSQGMGGDTREREKGKGYHNVVGDCVVAVPGQAGTHWMDGQWQQSESKRAKVHVTYGYCTKAMIDGVSAAAHTSFVARPRC